MKNHSKGHGDPSRRSRGRRKGVSVNEAAAPGPSDAVGASSSTTAVSSAAAEPVAPAGVGADLIAPAVAAAITSSAPAKSVDDPSGSGTMAPKPNRARADQIVQNYVPFAVGAGMIPLPGVDLAALGALQLKVLASLAQHYGVPFTREQGRLIVTSLVGSVGTTVLAGSAVVSAAKIIPFFGTLLGAASLPVAGGVVTHALGQLAIDHFEAGGTMDTFDLDVAQQAFLGKIAAAKAALA